MARQVKNIAVLILAAGSSSRMGQPKQLLPWKDTTLLGNAIRNAVALNPKSVIVVLGANAKVIREGIADNKFEVIENLQWKSGLGTSIAAGMNFLLKKKSEFDAVLIVLADQPLIDSDYLNLMITSFYNAPQSIIATSYKNRAGVPALFNSSYFYRLSQLEKDFGAKEIIDQNENDVLTIDPKNKSLDIDTQSEYQNIINNIK